MATVTYVHAAEGCAPTLVVERPSPLFSVEAAEGPVEAAHACFPRSGRHLVFDGKLLHGAPSGLPAPRLPAAKRVRSGATVERVTFLVNVWLNHVPWGAEALPAPLANALDVTSAEVSSAVRFPIGGEVGSLGGSRGSCVPALELQLGVTGAPAHSARRWSFGDLTHRLELELPWPISWQGVASGMPGSSFVALCFGSLEGSCELRRLTDVPKKIRRKKGQGAKQEMHLKGGGKEKQKSAASSAKETVRRRRQGQRKTAKR